MATPEAQEAAAKERIIKHMNADHQDSVRRYFEHAQGVSAIRARNARMTDISLTEMKFSTGSTETSMAFDPPMKSLREARERLVQLDKDTLVSLSRSDIAVTKYIPPYVHPAHLFNFSSCLLTYIVYSRPAHFRPGSLFFDNLFYKFPGFANFSLTIQPWLMTIMLAIHIYESSLMIRKLGKHGLTAYDGVWWGWLASCFVEGVTSFKRLDGLIAEKKKEKEAKKH
ncbi:integral membrane protein-like protein [Amniculicola lignicola CBS 123094]|uniref:Integral membrane protein-like protein n=1 Tax=Amniculicola lignicola CBS 123094 TaxID=1392246 RepID=A0A6A5WU20_9PLEO|nr:integral membrane protein-like protein [Amniculicola lignicola CBS 123094]